MTVLLPSWISVLPGLPAGLSGAAQCLRRAQIPCSWAALGVPSPPIANTPSVWTRGWALLVPRPAWAEQTSPSCSAGQNSAGRLRGAWGCGIHVTVGTFVCVYTKQLRPGPRHGPWLTPLLTFAGSQGMLRLVQEQEGPGTGTSPDASPAGGWARTSGFGKKHSP